MRTRLNEYYYSLKSDSEKIKMIEEMKIHLIDYFGYSRSIALSQIRNKFCLTTPLTNLIAKKELNDFLNEHFPLMPKYQKGKSIVGMLIKRIENDENRD